MICFDIRGVNIRFTFGFFAVWAWLLAAGGRSEAASAALVSCILHEFGHIIAMLLSGIKISRLTFYGGGIAMRSRHGTEAAGLVRELIILSAGCLVNLVIALFSGFAGNNTWVMVNLSLILFNLLPFSSLDGGRMIKAAAIKICPFTDIESAQRAADLIMGIAAVIFFIMYGSVNFTLPLSMALIIAEGIGQNLYVY